MPWECKGCQAQVNEDDLVCPACEAPKTTWTMVREKTRTFRVTGRRVEYLLGTGREATPPGDASREADGTIDADELKVLKKVAARELTEQGQLPPTRNVLIVRLYPKKQKDLTVSLTVLYEEDEDDEREFPFEGEPFLREDGSIDILFAFVYGGESMEGIAFEGIHVVDLSEDTEADHAPAIEVCALRKKPRKLPVVSERKPYTVSLQCFDRSGLVPVDAGLKWILTDVEDGQQWRGATDAHGCLRVKGVSLGYHELKFGEESIFVPVVHDSRLMTRARLPFFEVDPEDERIKTGRRHDWEEEERVQDPLEPDDEDEDEDEEDVLSDAFRFDQADDDDEPEEDEDDEDPEHDRLDEAVDGEQVLSARFLDRTGRIPYGDKQYSVNGRTGYTDADGITLLEDMPPGFVKVVFDEGQAIVPTLWTEEALAEVYLPFFEGDPEELERLDDEEFDAWWGTSEEGWPEDEEEEELPDWHPGQREEQEVEGPDEEEQALEHADHHERDEDLSELLE